MRGGEGGDCGGKCQWRKGRKPWKQGNTAESHIEGEASTIASLPRYDSISSRTIERLAHQTPDSLNCRAGPHPGAPLVTDTLICRGGPQPAKPLYVPDMLNYREGPQAREPSKCLNGRSYGKDWPNRLSDHQLPEAEKKDSGSAITPVTEAVRVLAHLTASGSPRPKQLRLLHAEPSLGQSCHQAKKSCVCAHRVASTVSICL